MEILKPSEFFARIKAAKEKEAKPASKAKTSKSTTKEPPPATSPSTK